MNTTSHSLYLKPALLQRPEALLRDPRGRPAFEGDDVRETEADRRRLSRTEQVSGTQGSNNN